MRGLTVAAALLAASGAQAAVLETMTMTTQYGYGFSGISFIASAQNHSFRDSRTVVGSPAEFGLDITTSSSNGSFSFLHNQYCVGKCSVFALTTVTFTLQNVGDLAAALRFDSLITPGHLARQGLNTSSFAGFDFDVTQTAGGVSRTLYAASGIASAAATEITTSNGVDFNGLTRNSNGAAWEVLDWSATNLNLALDLIPAGGTTTLVYRSMTQAITFASVCADLATCPGVQVAFGDPRNDGGGTPSSSRSSVASFVQDVAGPAPVIGRLFGATAVKAVVVDANAPLPPPPPILPPITYGAPFVSQVGVVPEPASWMMMIAGFGMIGSGMRRRVAKACAA